MLFANLCSPLKHSPLKYGFHVALFWSEFKCVPEVVVFVNLRVVADFDFGSVTSAMSDDLYQLELVYLVSKITQEILNHTGKKACIRPCSR